MRDERVMDAELNLDVTAQIEPNIDLEDIENDHMYLMGIVQDCSGSMNVFSSEMKQAMNNFVKSVKDSKQDDEMLVSITNFSDNVVSSGFQNVSNISTDFNAYGCTALYDAIFVAAKQVTDYMDQLNESGVRTRAGLVIFSDGYDNVSAKGISDAARVISELVSKEIVVAFVSFGNDADGIAESLGVSKGNILKTNATASDLRKVWGIISKSAISSSKNAALGNSSNSGFFDV